MEDNYFITLSWFLSYINMNWPSIYMRPLHPELPSFLSPHPVSSRLSQSTSFRCPASYVQLALTYGNIYVSILFSQIIPSSPSPTESKSLFFTSVSLLLLCTQDHQYHLSRFHTYALIYGVCLSVSDLLHSI